MATGPKGVCRELKHFSISGVVGTLSDAQLLEEFLARSGEAAEDAFAAVVERHGPMVLRVCRRILTEPNDAEDAFQVTFLVCAEGSRDRPSRAAGQLALWCRGPHGKGGQEKRRPPAGSGGKDGRDGTHRRRRGRKTSTSCGS